MFEILSGLRADDLKRYYYRNNQLHIFIDGCIRFQTDSHCFNILIEVAYRCIKRCHKRQEMSNRGGGGGGARGPGEARGRELRARYTMNEVVDRIQDAVEFVANEN
uniref:Uncharacterized protein n=1 Tax=Lactuca sativa TaxID=4236 RepID=A0A9R1WPY6_LACSA|nr:hypothetical protein LSAT_V11C100033140 [Lactuca sativa]